MCLNALWASSHRDASLSVPAIRTVGSINKKVEGMLGLFKYSKNYQLTIESNDKYSIRSNIPG